MNESPFRQNHKSQTQNFENEPVMLPCLHKQTPVVRQNHLSYIKTGRQVSALTSASQQSHFLTTWCNSSSSTTSFPHFCGFDVSSNLPPFCPVLSPLPRQSLLPQVHIYTSTSASVFLSVSSPLQSIPPHILYVIVMTYYWCTTNCIL